ncbi:MAG: SOS response-associated peptidase [Planctomycetales bacterium]|nr:SOS response-associated peptidase [Planctomycetales bacterium]
MCGRFTLRTPTNLLVQQFLLDIAPDLPPRYNIAPTQNVAVVRPAAAEGKRELTLLRWGLVPSWAKDASIGARMINARAETVAEKPAFRAAFKRRRCLVPADGYYEWKAPPTRGQGAGKASGKKQPYLFHLADDRPFALAGLWERWDGPSGDGTAGPLETCTLITTSANAVASPIHDRMPVLIAECDYEAWLDPQFQDKECLQAMLRPYAGDDLAADPVSTHVNSVRNDDPACVEMQRELF